MMCFISFVTVRQEKAVGYGEDSDGRVEMKTLRLSGALEVF